MYPLIIVFLEIICLIIDLFYFQAAVTHVLFIFVLIAAGLFSLSKNRRKALYAIAAIPIVLALSTTGYLIEWHIKNWVREVGNACFSSGKCDFPQSYLGYRIRPVYKAQGRARDMIVIDGYNHTSLIFDPATQEFTRGEF